MEHINPDPNISPRVLATDLDGTFIPLPGNAGNRAALERLRTARESRRFGLIYATGRHRQSVLAAIEEHRLPVPDWLVCDVGTSIYRHAGGGFELFAPFEAMLAEQTAGVGREQVEALLGDLAGMELQAAPRQGRFKVSYDSAAGDAPRLAGLANRRLADAGLPYACLASIDPFAGHGLLDVLPIGASKAGALVWLATHADFTPDMVVFAGDSGNDLAALTCGFRAIVVANAPAALVEQVGREMTRRGLADRWFHATLPATSGVLEGALHFGLLDAQHR
jgi:HAD superfamily hydrolase (TIGR01484 family)